MKYTLLLILFSLKAHAQLVEAEAFQKLIKDDPNAVIVDLRAHEIFSKGYIKNAICINYDNDNFDESIQKLVPKTSSVLIYGGSSFTTANAQVFLQEIGYSKVKGLEGGFSSWVAASKPFKSLQYDGPLATYTPQHFEAIKKRYPKLIVMLETPSCAYCKKMKPYFNQVAHNFNYKVLKIDIAQNENMSYYFQATGTPTIIVFNNQKQVWRQNGFVDENKLSQSLSRFL